MRIEFKGKTIYCNDAKELEEVLRVLERMDRPNVIGPWDAKLFWRFVDSLGKKQRQILTLLLNDKCSDEELRDALDVETNQQLAGLLSGISKQAAAVGLSARDVYKIETESKSNGLVKNYLIAPTFEHAARDNNWSESE